ncbi:MAG: hypothetical protein OEN23_05380 [Paracoccaceae bacterium]|nr:hypothetical protein [Paracoccaceae bacterium]
MKIRIASANETERPISEIQRQTVRQAGAIRRISVAVLVDGITTTSADGGEVWEPRPPEEIEALRELVTAAIGFDEARGDIVTVESMAFQADATKGALVEESRWMRLLERNAMTLIQIGILSIVVLVLALTVIRPLLTRPPARLTGPGGALPAQLAPGAPEAASAAPGAQALADGRPDGAGITLPPPGANPNAPQLPGAPREPNGDVLRSAVAEHPEDSATTLRAWLAPDGASGQEAA